ncbi:MAG: S41 family peptidase [Candidatus Paceibacterota bacterium]
MILTGLFLMACFVSFIIINTNNSSKKMGNPVDFLIEIYDKILENYWEKIDDKELLALYGLGMQKLGKIIDPTIVDVPDLKSKLEDIYKQIENDEDKIKFSTDLASIVLYNIKPAGRSGLYTEAKEKELWETVGNVDKTTNLYEEIGVSTTTPPEEISKIANEKILELNKIVNDKTKSESNRQEAEQKLAKVERAKETLTSEETKQTYDQSGTETTVYAEIINRNIFYIKIKRMSLTTPDEFLQMADKYKNNKELKFLILDLQGNIGGSIDMLPYLLGFFIGNNQYAYEFYHRGDFEPYKTKTDKIPFITNFKRVVILQDEKGQSSAELMASVLKKYNFGVLVGVPSMGWGTIERVFDIENQINDKETYKMFLVHRITLREDGQPIQDRGVDPVINITNTNWTTQLYDYVGNNNLVRVVRNLVQK